MSYIGIIGYFLGSIAILFVSNIVNAQLKPWDNSNEVLVDLNVINGTKVGNINKYFIANQDTNNVLLDPPSKMPISRYLRNRSIPNGVAKLPRIKLRSLKSLSKKKPNLRRLSKISRKRVAKHSVLTSRQTKNSIGAHKENKKSPVPPKKIQKLKRKTKQTSTPPTLIVKAPLPPAPKALPKPSVKVLETPPPKPKLEKRKVDGKLKSSRIQISSHPDKTNQEVGGNQLIFKQGDSALTSSAKMILDKLSGKLKAKPESRMQLLAYAGEPSISASRARRLSLSRALVARSYLIEKGIRSTRIDVRALGNKVPFGTPNRVDLKLIRN